MSLVSTTEVAERVASELATDLDMLAAAEKDGGAAFRTWTVPHHAVVAGIGVAIAEEVDEAACRDLGIPIVRRRSGGRSVVIGPGTLQYTFALPSVLSPKLGSIAGAKAFCNNLLSSALAVARPDVPLLEDASGDLILAGRKVAGLALKRRRRALFVHGSILANADIALIETVLKAPGREPAYRRGRIHSDFLANLGPLDTAKLQALVQARLRLVAKRPVG